MSGRQPRASAADTEFGRFRREDDAPATAEAAGLRAGRTAGDSETLTTRAATPVGSSRLAAPYRRRRPPQPIDLWLDGNECAAPPRSLLAELARSADGELLSRYPDASPLERDLAARFGVPPEAVLVTAGADEALDRICRAFLAPDRRALTTTPTFTMLSRYVALAGATLDTVEWWDGPFPSRPLRRAVAERRPAVVFLTSPVNPTGRVVPATDLRDLARSLPDAVLVADLAYVELADGDPTVELLRHPTALIVRTLSKAWGLAGLRVGYVLGSPDRIETLRAAGGPYPVAAPSLALARAWLRDGEGAVAAAVRAVRRQRRELTTRLRAAGFDVPESQANFVLARGRRASWLGDALAGLGIAVRRIEDPDGPGAVRITCPGIATAISRVPEMAGRDASHVRVLSTASCPHGSNSPRHVGDRHAGVLPAGDQDCHLSRLLSAIDVALAPEALLLDLDGVLADVRGSYDRAIIATVESWGVAATPADIERERNAGRANDDFEVTRRLLAAAGIETPPEEIARRFGELLEGKELWRHERALLPPRRLVEWRRRLPLAVVTGRPRREAVRFLARSGLAPAISALVCREDAPLKPNPEPMRKALACLGVTHAWMVGDTPDDIVAARRAGVVPIGVVPPGGDFPDCERALLAAGAARVLRNLQALEDLLP